MPGARDLAADLLLGIEKRGGRVRTLLGPAHEQLVDPRERSLLTELAYGVLRRRGTLDAVLTSASRRKVAKLAPAVRTALRVGLHQILFLDRVPDHAAVDHAVGWANDRAGRTRAGYVNAVLRALLRDRVESPAGDADLRRDVPREDGVLVRFGRAVFADPDKDPAGNLAGRFSIPRWLVARWLERFGSRLTETALRAGITRPPVTVRARIEAPVLSAVLKARDVPFRPGPVPDALLLEGAEGTARSLVASGEATVQDATSQRVAPLLGLEGGERVLDLCAAPGGKTLHAADLMGSGTLVACDVDDEKIAVLEQLADRVGGVDYEVVQVKRKGRLPFAPASFDAVIVDAPCTNTGVLRRRVEARWRLKPSDIGSLAALQFDLLSRARPLVRPGGVIVYSTCSLETEENEDVLAAFTEGEAGLEGEVAFRVGPGRDQDGGFAAVIRVR
jgi:16S rRNA (cytosine967-C5)-methyltransferase